MTGTILFFVFAAVVLASAVLVIASRSVVHSALYLILSFLGVAGLFILQGAEFLGAVQILLYAGSIVVMFVFVVMMVNLKEPISMQWTAFRSVGAYLLGGVMLVELFWIAGRAGGWLAAPSRGLEPGQGHIEVLGKVLFRQYLLPFELLSLVLLTAIFGLLVIGRRK
jgi:NADH-quinone oxidoreductase subunit J